MSWALAFFASYPQYKKTVYSEKPSGTCKVDWRNSINIYHYCQLQLYSTLSQYDSHGILFKTKLKLRSI